MIETKTTHQRERPQAQTLMIAALASATAAIVTSHFWKGGTVISAAMTPVIVAIVSDLIRRPIESQVVRRPVQRVSEVRTARRGAREAVAAGRGASAPPPPGPAYDERLIPALDGEGNGGGAAAGPVRVYRSAEVQPTRRQPLHLRVALVTGLLAFVLAVAALTVPELIFGQSVTGNRHTTIFGGASHSRSAKDRNKDRGQAGDKNRNGSEQTAPSSKPKEPSSKPQTKPDKPKPSGQQQQPPSQQPPSSNPSPTPSPPPVPQP